MSKGELSGRRAFEIVLFGAAVLVAMAKIVPAVAPGQSVWIDSTMLQRTVPPIVLSKPPSEFEQSFTDGTVRVVIVYSPQCSACQRVRREWERLAEELPQSVEVVAFSAVLPDTSSFLNPTRIRTERVASLGSLRKALPFRGVPVTIVVSGNGRIVLWINGAFDDAGGRVIQEAVRSAWRDDAGGSSRGASELGDSSGTAS
jgi:hypothetical protein